MNKANLIIVNFHLVGFASEFHFVLAVLHVIQNVLVSPISTNAAVTDSYHELITFAMLFKLPARTAFVSD